MKRLMAAGGEAIYQITRAFRGGEIGPLHNPEFTIVEWYRRGDTMAEGMQLLSDLGETLFGPGPGRAGELCRGVRLARGIDPHRATVDQLRAAAERLKRARHPAALPRRIATAG